MKSLKYLVLFILALTLTLPSCKKDEVTMTKEEMLTAKSWKVTSSKDNGVENVREDCMKDDFLTFATNGTYTVNPGTIKCASNDVTETGSWSLSSDEKYLTVDADEIMTIVQLTKTTLVLTKTTGTDTYEMTLVAF